MKKFTIQIIVNIGNRVISIIETFTPEDTIKIIIVVIANNSVAPFIIIIEDNKYPNDLFFIINTPDIIAAGTIKPKSIA